MGSHPRNPLRDLQAADLRDRLRQLVTAVLSRNDALRDLASMLSQNQWQAVIFGGTLRDLVISGALPRDVDIVVDIASLQPLESAYRSSIVRSTRFGGLHLQLEAFHVDIWPLAETWAFKQGLVTPVGFRSLPATTFLNVEAVTIDLFANKPGQECLFEHGFFDSMIQKQIEINLEPNPYPNLAVVRSLLTAARLNFSIGDRLARYISRVASQMSVAEFEAVQMKHYGEIKIAGQELKAWVESIDVARTSGEAPINLPISHGKRQLLQGAWVS